MSLQGLHIQLITVQRLLESVWLQKEDEKEQEEEDENK